MLQSERRKHEKRNTWRVNRSEWPDGPWDQEPEDRIEWRDAGTNLPCVMVRNSDGAWCGYVGTPPKHPSHLADEIRFELELTYGAGQCSWPVCHTPAPGETDRFRWVGFDCAHSDDVVPGRRQRANAVYRTRDWVREKVTLLAITIANITPPTPKPPPTEPELEQRTKSRRRKQRGYAKKRRATLAERKVCINNAAHGKATHGVLCRGCRAIHRGVPIEQVPEAA